MEPKYGKKITPEQLGNSPTGTPVAGGLPKEKQISGKHLSRLEQASKIFDTVFGGGKVGEALGTGIAKTGLTGLTPEQRQYVSAPSAREVAGSALQSAALFTPIGRVAGAITRGAGALGMKTGVSAIGKIGAGAVAGGAFDVAQNLQDGELAFKPGLGTAIGAGIPAVGVAKNVLGRFSSEQAPRVINSLIKPLAKDFSYGKNPGRAIAEEKIVANNWDDLISKISTRRQEVGAKIGALGRRLEGKVKLNLQNAMSPLDDAMQTAASQNNPTLLNRLQNVKRAVVENLAIKFDKTGAPQIITTGMRNITSASFKESRDMLRHIGDITQFTGNPSDDKLVNSALKRVYGKIKEQSVNAAHKASPSLGKEFEKLTEKYADLSSAQIAAKYRDKIVERSNLVSLSPQIAGIGTALLTFVATGGAATPAILAGLAGGTLDKLASTPAFKTRLASILAKKSAQEVNILFQKIPALQKLFPKGSPVSPGDRLLQTRAGQKLEAGAKNYAKSPKLGLSIEDVSKKNLNNLAQEARKYKTAEEFVRGQPTLYHGTTENFDTFKLQGGKNLGPDAIFVSPQKSVADYYAQGIGKNGVSQAKEAYITSGKIFDYKNPKDVENLWSSLSKKTKDEIMGFETTDYVSMDKIRNDIIKGRYDILEKPVVQDTIKKLGYDGFHIRDYTGGDATGIFNPDILKTKSQLTDIWNKAHGK